MDKQAKKKILQKQIVRIEALIGERQPALDAEGRRIIDRLSRRLIRRKQMLIVLSFPNGN